MAVDVIEKKKRGLTCAECGASLEEGATECSECGSTKIKKSLIVVRKSVADTDDEIQEIEDELDDTVEDDDEDLEPLDDDEDEEDEEEEEEEDDDEDDEDDEDEEDEDDEPVTKSHSLVGVEALNISTAFAQDIVKVFQKPSREGYEAVMSEFNDVMDAAADVWFAGGKVSKSNKKAPHASVILGRVNSIIKHTEGKNMPKNKRPKGFDALDDETKAYITELEGGEVEKSISKRADLPEDVRKSLEAADKIVEEREQEKWLNVAKGYSHFPGKPEELAKTLRTLSESAPEAFTELTKSLDAAQEQLEQSDIFKSHGSPRSGGDISKNAAREEKISKVLADNPGMTREQAEVSLMDGSAYAPTNA